MAAKLKVYYHLPGLIGSIYGSPADSFKSTKPPTSTQDAGGFD